MDGIPATLAERLEQLQKKEASIRAETRGRGDRGGVARGIDVPRSGWWHGQQSSHRRPFVAASLLIAKNHDLIRINKYSGGCWAGLFQPLRHWQALLAQELRVEHLRLVPRAEVTQNGHDGMIWAPTLSPVELRPQRLRRSSRQGRGLLLTAGRRQPRATLNRGSGTRNRA